MTPKCPDCKRDQDECVCLAPDEMQQIIERQAAQIEMLRKALKLLSYMAQTTGNVMGKDAGLMDGIKAAEQALATTQDQALEQFAAKVREQCAQMLLNGSFLHDQSPARLLAIEAAKAIRAITELPPAN